MQPTIAYLEAQRGKTGCHGQANMPTIEQFSVYDDCQREAEQFKWIESEKAGCDLGEEAIRRWVRHHWCGFLRARWLEHLQGRRYWIELDRGDFGLLLREFHDHALLLDRILDRLKAGHENLQIILWAIEWNVPIEPVLLILRALDINSRRLAHRFNCA
jgi:hypothetical protein